jgi:hypothetical protein
MLETHARDEKGDGGIGLFLQSGQETLEDRSIQARGRARLFPI